METHTKNYFKYFGYDTSDTILCEICGGIAVDIHHIQKRSSFGSKRKKEQDEPQNLIALCRQHHMAAHLQVEPYLLQDELQRIHNNKLWK